MKKNWKTILVLGLLLMFTQMVAKAEKTLSENTIQQNIIVEKDVPFGETVNFKGEKEVLLLDIYSPPGELKAGRPAIFWMHGGGFRYGNDKEQRYIVDMSNRFANRGFVCISINYRVRENPRDDKRGTVSDALEDAMKGLNWVRENSKKLGIDTCKIVVGGGSAGGILGTNFCFREGGENEKWDKSGIIAFVNLWGSPDDTWGTFKIDKKDPPTIIVHGTEDELVPYGNSKILVAKLNAAGVQNQLITIEGAGHTPVKHMDDFENNIAAFLAQFIK